MREITIGSRKYVLFEVHGHENIISSYAVALSEHITNNLVYLHLEDLSEYGYVLNLDSTHMNADNHLPIERQRATATFENWSGQSCEYTRRPAHEVTISFPDFTGWRVSAGRHSATDHKFEPARGRSCEKPWPPIQLALVRRFAPVTFTVPLSSL
jgi:hypothetical protein